MSSRTTTTTNGASPISPSGKKSFKPLKAPVKYCDERNQWLQLDDEHLLRDCSIDFHKQTGPGGQKKNKTSSAVRLIHTPSGGIQGIAGEERQQSVNKIRAIRRLRMELALQLRCKQTKWEGSWDMNPKNPEYALFIATIFDVLHAHNFEVSSAAKFLERSTGQLIKTLAREEQVWKHCNSWRQRFNQSPLKKR